MPTDAALNIVNQLFAGQKDLADYVATGMSNAAIGAIDDKKVEIGKQVFNPNAPEEDSPQEETPEVEATTDTEETTDETDQGRD
tara:strand:- start:789 stop:1040 length:252 start_codon:yes stop_codon:yes gene_type:complete